MKKFLSVLAVATALAMPVAPTQAASIIFSPSTSSVGVGGTVDINIIVTGLTALGEIVSGFDLNILYTQAIADAESVAFNLAAFGGAADTLSGFLDSAGDAGIDLVSLLTDADVAALQGDSVLLATLTFRGVADGFTQLAFGPNPDVERNVVGRNGLSLQLTYGTACIAVGTANCPGIPIPEPSALLLMAAGLFALFVIRRASRRRG